ncbi:cell death abnormality protein 1-like [Cyclospora cayetanensis]|uniref:Cell death abnormality protein 1-like n=1 Tax=Cyclospora cayetanensis TaxID=88456 RepID=A0A6P6RRJ1_9EIME|nr:cell death abnormality protein 1-like [Cyclospora cayetanensis]
MARTSKKQLVVPCWPGHYCPEGSASPTAQPCPAGTVNHSTGGTSLAACLPCPAGWLCAERSFQAVGFQACPPGHYCVEGSSKGKPCPAGTYTPYPGASDRMTSADKCTPCVAGYYCKEGNSLLDMLSQPCPPGRVCPAGTTSDKGPKCPPGFYSPVEGLTHEAECLPCPAGSYCDYGGEDSAPDRVTGQCPDGTMSLNTGHFGDKHAIRPIEPVGGQEAQCVTCDPGYKCSGGIRSPCGRGYYSDGSGECKTCLAGHYCWKEATTSQQMDKQKCPAGAYCEAGTSSIPLPASHPCPSGSYCPEVRFSSLPCRKDCCVPVCNGVIFGRLCHLPWIDESKMKATRFWNEACLYNSLENVSGVDPAGDSTGCVLVSAGQYASQPGLSEAEGECQEGYYCPEGSTSATMNRCPNGTYGYLCYGGASSPRPTDGVTGELCTPGGYCKRGATTKSYCPRGTYNPSPGASSKDQCIHCPPGAFCTGSDSTEPDGPCSPGAYCTGGADIPRWVTKNTGEQRCEPCHYGMYCPEEGTPVEKPCPVGTYRDTGYGSSLTSCHQCPPYKACTKEGETRKELVDCEAGFYCIYGSWSTEPSESDLLYDPIKGGPCPPGLYCERSQPPMPCPRGTLGTAGKQTSPDECPKCPEGRFCEHLGTLTAKPCTAGFFCLPGTIVAERINTICPEGSVCPAGSSGSQACAIGTFAPLKGMEQCIKCPAGYLCANAAADFDTQPCPVGHFCITGTSEKRPCPAGTAGLASNLSNSSLCLACPSGHYCPTEAIASGDQVQECSKGKYCNPGTKGEDEQVICPVGYYCPKTSSTPIPCKGGKLCTMAGLESPDEDCSEGLYCQPGTEEYTPAEGEQCPGGAYCPIGSASPLLCPIGKVSPTSGERSEDSCVDCPAGSYCGFPGLTTYQGLCSSGYFCPEGSIVAEPQEHRCPVGHKCPAGSSVATPCNPDMNEYQPRRAQAFCESCPAGSACDSGSATLCPTGQYCPLGMKPQKCAAGTFNPLSGAQSAAFCLACLPGHACTKEGLSKPDAKCSAGHFCVAGASTQTPEDEWIDGGGACTPGYFCPEGSTVPTPCPNGKYCPDAKATLPKGECMAGHYCAHHATNQRATTAFSSRECPSDVKQGVCPLGSFCPPGAVFPYKCPPGTVRSTTGGTSITDCQPCPEGNYCTHIGASTVNLDRCLDGRHCKEGSRVC